MLSMTDTLTLNKDLMLLGLGSFKKMIESNTDSAQSFIAEGSELTNKMREIADPGEWLAVQQEYGQSMWEGWQAWLGSQNEIMRDWFEEAAKMMREAYAAPPIVEEARAKPVQKSAA